MSTETIEDIFSRAIEYTKQIVKYPARWLLLGVIYIVPILNFIALGYLAEVIRRKRDDMEIPPLSPLGKKFIDGLKIIVVILIYMIPTIVLTVVLLTSVITSMMPLALALHTMIIPVFTAALPAIVLSFAILLWVFAAILHMIKKDELSKAFAITEIADVIKKIGAGKYLITVVILAIIAYLVELISRLADGVGLLIAIAIAPPYILFTGKILNLLYPE